MLGDDVRVGVDAIAHAKTHIPDATRVGLRHIAVPTSVGHGDDFVPWQQRTRVEGGWVRVDSEDVSLEGWDIVSADQADWVPWTGAAGEARAKILGSADGYTVVLVEAQPGYVGSRHEHAHAEFHYVVEGTLRNQGQPMSAGDGYAAAAGSTHTDFATETGATYIVIFKI